MPHLVNNDINTNLLKPFTEEEINKFVWDMESDKASDLDGFSLHFYKACWIIIKTNLLRMVKAFQQKVKVGGNTNSTFLALTPKK